jgi:hypothetical protein
MNYLEQKEKEARTLEEVAFHFWLFAFFGVVWFINWVFS